MFGGKAFSGNILGYLSLATYNSPIGSTSRRCIFADVGDQPRGWHRTEHHYGVAVPQVWQRVDCRYLPHGAKHSHPRFLSKHHSRNILANQLHLWGAWFDAGASRRGFQLLGLDQTQQHFPH